MLASLTRTQLSSGSFRKIERTGPARRREDPPSRGVIVTDSSLRTYAQLPRTRISFNVAGRHDAVAREHRAKTPLESFPVHGRLSGREEKDVLGHQSEHRGNVSRRGGAMPLADPFGDPLLVRAHRGFRRGSVFHGARAAGRAKTAGTIRSGRVAFMSAPSRRILGGSTGDYPKIAEPARPSERRLRVASRLHAPAPAAEK